MQKLDAKILKEKNTEVKRTASAAFPSALE